MESRKGTTSSRLTKSNLDRLEAAARDLLCRQHQANPNPSEPEKVLQRLRLKHPVMAEMGRMGGRKGGPKRAAALTPEERSQQARKAAHARWAKAKRSTPEEQLTMKRAKARRWAQRLQAGKVAARRAAGLPPKKAGRPKKIAV